MMLDCPACGRMTRAHEMFCAGCGSATGRVAKIRDVPHDFTAWSGERKHLSVLFADLCGSTERIADIDPEEARRLLDAVIARMVDAVRQFGGFVPQVNGDGILAVFGAPAALEDHAVRACTAADLLHRSIRHLSARHGEKTGKLQVRIGIHSGLVVVTASQDTAPVEYRVYGSAIHLAARVEQRAPPGSTLITLATANLIGERWALGPPTAHPVKGFATPVTLRQLLASQSGAEGLHPYRIASPLAGRRPELRALKAALSKAEAGTGQVIIIRGEAGVGKSRLIRELAKAEPGWRVLVAQAKATMEDVPDAPIVGLLHRWMGVQAPLPRVDAEATLKKALSALDPLLLDAAPALLWLADPDGWSDRIAWMAPAQRRAAAHGALDRIFRAEAALGPVLIVVEDLHWSDEETEQFLDQLAATVRETRIVLVLTARPEYDPRCLRLGSALHIPLGPLDTNEAAEFLASLVGRDPSLHDLAKTIGEHCAGNPFFIEEMVWALAENGVLEGAPGCYRLTDAPRSLPIPPSVEDLLSARIDRLGSAAKRVLRCAAVVGPDQDMGTLRAVCDLAEETLRSAINELEAAGLLVERDFYPELRYAFRHALTHKVAYGGLLNEHRVALHARVATTLIALPAEAKAHYLEAIGAHALNGGLWEEATEHLRQAGLRASARSAHRHACEFIEEALEALGHLPPSIDRDVREVDLLCDMRVALWALGKHDRIVVNLKRAAKLAARAQDRRRCGRVASFLVQEYRMAGRHAEAIATGAEALAIGETTGDRELIQETRFRLALAHLNLGEFSRTRALLECNVADLEGIDRQIRLKSPGLAPVLARTWLAVCLCEMGEIAAALEVSSRAVSIASALDQGYSLVSAEFALGCAQRYAGDLRAATRTLEEGLERCERTHIIALRAPILFELGLTRLEEGRLAEAVEMLGRASDLGLANPKARNALYLSRYAEALSLLGQSDLAQTACDLALAEARSRAERGHEAWALRSCCILALHHIPPREAEAREACGAAIAIATSLGMRPLSHQLQALERTLLAAGPAETNCAEKVATH